MELKPEWRISWKHTADCAYSVFYFWLEITKHSFLGRMHPTWIRMWELQHVCSSTIAGIAWPLHINIPVNSILCSFGNCSIKAVSRGDIHHNMSHSQLSTSKDHGTLTNWVTQHSPTW
jgi:hypothetical protein